MLLRILMCLIISFNFLDTTCGQSNYKSPNIEITSNPPGAMVYIEGGIVGITPCELTFGLVGKYRVRAYKRGCENWKSTVYFNDGNNSPLNIKLSSKTRFKAAIRSFILPGWGQNYSDKKIKGTIILFIQACSIISTVFFEENYRNAVDNYNDALKNYNSHLKNYDKKAKYWLIVEDKFSKVNSFHEKRKIFLWTTGAIWLYNILDAIFTFPTYYEQILGENSLSSAYRIYNGESQILISKTFNLD